MKKIPALVATAVSAVLVASVGVQTTSAGAATAADGSSGPASFTRAGAQDAAGHG